MPAPSLPSTAPWRFLLLAGVAAVLGAVAPATRADPRTVCTITVNSPDEKEAMRRHLPPGDYRFVELVEHGRPDWLDSACRRNVQCDVLVVSGHFNGHDFFSDKIEASEYLPVAEMERASCSNACPSLFSHLKEVYLFGCTSLSPEAAINPAGEIERTLARAGMSSGDAQRIAQSSAARHGESNRDVMRRVFVNVPAIYGFSSVAPLGPVSGGIIDRYFRASGRGTFGTGTPNRPLLGAFAAHSMAVVPGLRNGDREMAYRADVCRFSDDRETPASRLAFVHTLLMRNMAEARLFFDHIEAFLAHVTDADRDDPAFVAALAELADDGVAREHFLAYARANSEPGVRARMLAVAHEIGWLDPQGYAAEQTALLRDLLAQPVLSTADIALACRITERGALAAAGEALQPVAATLTGTDRAAVLACAGSDEQRARVLAALGDGDENGVRVAEVYLAARPLATAAELREVVTAIGAASNPDAQARAIDVLAHQPVHDAAGMEALVTLFERTRSVKVQRAIAGVLLRADRASLATPDLLRTLRTSRLRSSEGQDVIDILIRRLQDGVMTASVPVADRGL